MTVVVQVPSVDWTTIALPSLPLPRLANLIRINLFVLISASATGRAPNRYSY
jgi:hypothetical protein